MNAEQAVLEAFERGKAFGFAEGMKSMRLKELTDEEIEEQIDIVYKNMLGEYIEEADLWHFAKAILRKAQEK